MPASIGIRVYQATTHKKNGRGSEPVDAGELNVDLPTFMARFVGDHVAPMQNDELERSWYFEEKESDENQSRGYVHYGTFGFESNLVNSRTKKTKYRRQVDDVEEIPLFYETWCPRGNFGLLAFQSFQGRSCIALVMHQMQEAFERLNPGYAIRFKKLLPNGRTGSLYFNAPVKRLRLIKRNASHDEIDRYFPGTNPRSVSFEVSAVAKRRQELGTLGAVSRELRQNAAGVVVHDGIAFDEAVAEISVGGKLRRVGVFGSDSEAGVIDLTEDIERGPDGHPTFESLAEQSDAILNDFYQVLTG
jgi:hypothetical protein